MPAVPRRNRRVKAASAPDRPLATRLKLRQLALIVAIAERRSLRQAANDVAITQPAATKLLRDLEDAVGLTLFTRHAWGMAPTAYGEALVRHARGAAHRSRRSRQRVVGARGRCERLPSHRRRDRGGPRPARSGDSPDPAGTSGREAVRAREHERSDDGRAAAGNARCGGVPAAGRCRRFGLRSDGTRGRAAADRRASRPSVGQAAIGPVRSSRGFDLDHADAGQPAASRRRRNAAERPGCDRRR